MNKHTTPAQPGAFWARAWTQHHARPAHERNRTACRERRDRLRAAGLCVFCGHNPARSPSPLCAGCRTRQADAARERYEAARALVGVRPYRRRKGVRREPEQRA